MLVITGEITYFVNFNFGEKSFHFLISFFLLFLLTHSHPSRNDSGRGICRHAQSCPILCDPVDYSPTRLLCSWNFPVKNTGVGCHFLLYLLIHSKALNSLTWVVCFKLTVIVWCLTTCFLSVCFAKAPVHSDSSLTCWAQSLRTIWGSRPQSVCPIKHNSQLICCAFFFQSTPSNYIW